MTYFWVSSLFLCLRRLPASVPMIFTYVALLTYCALYACISRQTNLFYDFIFHLSGLASDVYAQRPCFTATMFSKPHQVHKDLSTDLHDELDWKPGSLQTLDIPLNVTSLAVEPIAGFLAAGKFSPLLSRCEV